WWYNGGKQEERVADRQRHGVHDGGGADERHVAANIPREDTTRGY
ncbi:jg22872, partial [Pararge aegeria aegeria]